jgi:hypothetical protein
MAKSKLEDAFVTQLVIHQAPAYEREYRFHPTRKWRFDFAWPKRKVAVEIQGGVWSGGAHGRGSGITRNFEKYNAAAVLGWRVLQGDASMIRESSLVEDTIKTLAL